MGASTLVVAREDLSIPGAELAASGADGGAVEAGAEIETRFFNVLQEYNPDAVVLDLTLSEGNGIGAILKIRRRSPVPVLAVCAAGDPQMREYCLAGAAECLVAPVDIMVLNQTVQKIIQLGRSAVAAEPTEALAAGRAPKPAGGTEIPMMQPVSFAGLTLYPHHNLLVRADGAATKLTTSENRVLSHFVNNPLTLCSRDALAQALYGPHRPNSDRAVDVIVTRLRKKITVLGGPSTDGLIKTEFRRGYVFVAEVATGVAAAAEPPRHVRTA